MSTRPSYATRTPRDERSRSSDEEVATIRATDRRAQGITPCGGGCELPGRWFWGMAGETIPDEAELVAVLAPGLLAQPAS